MYGYFFTKGEMKWSESSVRFEKLGGNGFWESQSSVRLYLTVLERACMNHTKVIDIQERKTSLTFVIHCPGLGL